MTEAAEKALEDLLAAVLDGEPIDWEARVGAGCVDRATLDRLRLIASVVEVHSTSTDGAAGPVSAGERWGHLRVLDLIGRGANGWVYRAWDEKLDREVALKLLPARQPSDRQPANPILEEGRILARVRHPNVVTIHGADVIDGLVGLWMERVTGRTLDAIVKDGKKLTAAEVAALGAEIARAVAAVHAAGLVHRDIKASNVMIADDGRPVLMDFGTGSEIAEAGATLAGTPLYLAPELFRGGAPSPSSDVYSLGVLLHHLLTGSYPVMASDLTGLREAHSRNERIDVRIARRDVSAKLASAIARALDRDPARRHASADGLAAELDAIATSRFGGGARAIAAVVALLLVAGGAWELRSALSNRPNPSRTTVDEPRSTVGTEPPRYDVDDESYELYLRARALTEAGKGTNAGAAVALFRRIISDHPGFAPAYAGLADAYFLGSLTAVDEALRFDTILGPMREAAVKALELDPLLAEAHAGMGAVYARELRWEDSESSFRRAIDLDPARTSSYTLFAIATLRPLGEHAEARRILELARAQDPLSLDVQFELGTEEFFDGRYNDAVATLRPLLAEDVDPVLVSMLLARSLTFAGRIDEALEVWQSTHYEGSPSWYAQTLMRAGRREEVEALARANIGKANRQLFIQAALGNRDLAFAALERLEIEQPHRVPLVLQYPELEILRGDPRFDAIRRRFRLP